MTEEHYFTADPQAAFRRIPVSANVWGHWLDLTSGSGVFAQGRLVHGNPNECGPGSLPGRWRVRA